MSHLPCLPMCFALSVLFCETMLVHGLSPHQSIQVHLQAPDARNCMVNATSHSQWHTYCSLIFPHLHAWSLLWVLCCKGHGPSHSGIPAAWAAFLTAANPGMRGPRTGSTMQSESRALPVSLAEPWRMPATCTVMELSRGELPDLERDTRSNAACFWNGRSSEVSFRSYYQIHTNTPSSPSKVTSVEIIAPTQRSRRKTCSGCSVVPEVRLTSAS